MISLTLGISRNEIPAPPMTGFRSLWGIYYFPDSDQRFKASLAKGFIIVVYKPTTCLKCFSKCKESNNVDLNKREFIGQGVIEERIRRGHIQRTGTEREEANLRRQQHCKMIYL